MISVETIFERVQTILTASEEFGLEIKCNECSRAKKNRDSTINIVNSKAEPTSKPKPKREKKKDNMIWMTEGKL